VLILELLWWIGWAWCAAWVALPLAAVPLLGPIAGVTVWAVLAPWSALLGMAVLHRLLPAAEAGTFRLPGDRGSVVWALKGWAPALYLTVFQPLFFHSRLLQRVVLRAFGARLGAGAWLTSRTVVREPHHVRVGARSVVGEFAHLACSYQPRPGLLVVAGITIGDDSLVGAYSHLAPGATVGSRCLLEHAVAVGGRTIIGDDTRIGAGTAIYNAVRIGRGVTVGKNCVIPSGAVIADGADIPDGTVVAVHAARRSRAVPA
jgi:acetyltransferase-like isoleucine patch superfamily enzyme